MTEYRQWVDVEVAMIEQMLHSDAYQLLLDDYVKEHAARLTTRLTAKDCDWDEVQRIRGELQGIGRFAPKAIRSKYPPQSDKP